MFSSFYNVKNVVRNQMQGYCIKNLKPDGWREVDPASTAIKLIRLIKLIETMKCCDQN